MNAEGCFSFGIDVEDLHSAVIPALGAGIDALGLEEGVDPGTKSRDDEQK